MRKDLVDEISAQALNEIQLARTFKQGKTTRWRLNEEMYYGRKLITNESRANVQLARMQEFVHTLLSKIDNPLVFKYIKQKNSQTKRVERLNALRKRDQKIDSWDMKDLVGKKQGIIYGRAAYSYFADSINKKYRPHLENIDVYDLLVDPMCGGIDLEEARHLGSYSVALDAKQLSNGMKEGYFRRDTVKRLLEGSGNADDMTQEETNQQGRTQDQNTIGRKMVSASKGSYKFWRWHTTYKGDRVYLLMTNAGDVVRAEWMEDMFPTTEEYEQGMWPYWSWAAFPDLTEFWTPSYCDYVREIFMAQDVTVNQALDNVEAINKPMKKVNVSAIENLAELKYRRDGIIKVKGDVRLADAVEIVTTPSIDTPLKLFTLLEGIQSKASGVTDQQKGVANEEGKVGIYEGNEAAASDRFGLLDKSYAFGYERFAKLYQLGVREHLIKPVAIEILGPNGVELVNVKKGDIFKKGDDFPATTEASNAEMMASEGKKKAQDAFLATLMQDPMVNKKKLREMRGENAGLTQEQIDALLDTSVYGNADLLVDADADIEAILLGENITPNRNANNAYRQRFVDYMGNHSRELSTEDFGRLTAYVEALEPVVMRNEARALLKEQSMPPSAPVVPGMPGPTPALGAPIITQ